ncbi:MAG: PilW family protein [Thermodesulfobacteriota bacterium]
MRKHRFFNCKGITIIELMVALVIFGLVVGGIYRVFVAQTKAYTVQDQVVEVQQSVRSAMEILLRDLRMAGYDDESSPIVINTTIPPNYDYIVYPPQENSITVNYEYYDTTKGQFQRHTVSYWFDQPSSRLMRQLTIDNVAGFQEVLLENVDALQFTYGVDGDEDGAIDDWNGDGVVNDSDFISAGDVGTRKVVAVRVQLTARPSPTHQDIQKTISPRTLVSAVTLRNICLR